MSETKTSSGEARCAAWAERGRRGEALSREEAAAALDPETTPLLPLAHAAGAARQTFWGHEVTIHVLDNVRNGACLEDCGYCGQSRDSKAAIQAYKLKPVARIVEDAEAAREQGAFRFCMAVSGRGPSEGDIDRICEAVRRINGMGMRTCLSAGLLDAEKAQRLKEAGLDRLNHNLNTSRRHYPSICTTHTYDDRLETLRAAQNAGLGLCSGLIVGMNETREDLLDVGEALQEIGAESVPVNFLLPIDGNPVNAPRHEERALSPGFALRVLCLFRLMLPAAEVRVAAGREHHLRDLQALALWPASSLFMEGYLLTQGQEASDTLRMILDAGFTPRLEAQAPEALRNALAEAGAAEAGEAPSAPALRPEVQRRGREGREAPAETAPRTRPARE
jgi:biotin synthase